jgi:DNA polymerase I-like protein with 3'-5' exonuclease and polymerase domains
MLISLDTETTGLDIAFGARPFMVTVCREDGQRLLWEWDVDPLTRRVLMPPGEAAEVRQEVEDATEIVLHGAKFDAKMLQAAGVVESWPWHKTRCTLVAGHLLASGMPHDLTSMVLQYTGHDIKPLETALREAVLQARRLVKQFDGQADDESVDLFDEGSQPLWHVAKEGDPTMPSCGGEAWHFDYALPRAVAKHLDYPVPATACDHVWTNQSTCLKCEGHRWWVVCSTYALADPEHGLLMWQRLKKEIERRDLWDIYKASMELPRVIADMETRGVTYNVAEGRRLLDEYQAEADAAGKKCLDIATSLGYDLQLPKSTRNQSLSRFCFGWDQCMCQGCGLEFRGDPGAKHKCKKTKCADATIVVEKRDALRLPPVAWTDTGNPSLSDEAFTLWGLTLERGSPQMEFVDAMTKKSQVITSANYLRSYDRFAVRIGGDFGVLNPNLNQTGTGTLRMSSNCPNSQNVSKKLRTCAACKGTGEVGDNECHACGGEGEVSFNLRRAFCPSPGREFWALDFENVEMRIPGYKAGQKEWIELFEKPNDPPYFGSQHLLNASIIFPEQFWPVADFNPDDKKSFKKRYASTFYQRIKGFDFALNYQCGEATGDAAAGVPGAWRLVKHTLKELTKYNDHWVNYARRNGYVETVPDKTVDPRHGYPIMCGRGGGDVSPTVPLNYHVQSTAMWATRKAMVRADKRLKEFTVADSRGYYIALQIHDEILFDFPAGGKRNLPRIMEIKKLMEQSGDDFDIPLRVSVSWHPVNWANGEEIK